MGKPLFAFPVLSPLIYWLFDLGQATFLLEPQFPHVLGVFLIAEPALDRGAWVLRECSEENPEGWEG